MASCQPKIPEIKYKDEGWWREFFNELVGFYSTLKGFIDARNNLLNNLSNLQQAFNDPNHCRIALEILLGGVDPNCVARASIDNDCIPNDSIAGFYREILGIGVDLNNLNKLLETYRYYAGGSQGFDCNALSRASVGINVMNLYSPVMSVVDELHKITYKILANVKNVIPSLNLQPKNYVINNSMDLVNALIDVYNSGMRLLPLYNPVTFFVQSLVAPKPYLLSVYCNDVFDEQNNPMYKYGFKLTEILTPDLNDAQLNKELAIIGHQDNSTGDLVIKLIRKLYELNHRLFSYKIFKIENEYGKYVNKYKQYLDTLLMELSHLTDLNPQNIGSSMFVSSRGGKIKLYIINKYGPHKEIEIEYFEFIRDFSAPLFLGLLQIDKRDQNSLTLIAPW
ncbi:MAG: hypothetical protein L7H08_05025 [Vulcanisaeta sp.]|nr:hypothetical protein [Vulcanisaeta sp.]